MSKESVGAKSTARPARDVEQSNVSVKNIWDSTEIILPRTGDLVIFKNSLWGYNINVEGFQACPPTKTYGKFIDSEAGCVCLDIIKLECDDHDILKGSDYHWCFYFLICGEVYCVYEWDYQIAMGKVVQSVSNV